MGLDMTPALVVHDTADQLFADPVLDAHLALDAPRASGGTTANREHLLRRQFGADLVYPLSSDQLLSPVIPMPPLCHLIGDVISVGSKKEVGRADAGWIVTGMENLEPFGDRAVHQFPLYSVAQPVDVMIRVPNMKRSVAVSVPVSSPSPALRGNLGVVGHTFDGGCSTFTHCIAMLAQSGVEMQPDGGQ